MTDTPNCSNCANEQCPINTKHKDSDGFVLVQDSPTTVIRREQVRLYGCLSHPDARAYLMRDVIGELERRITTTEGMAKNRKIAGYEEALTLIKNGLKKRDP